MNFWRSLGVDVGDIAAVIAALTALVAVFLGNRNQLRIARTQYVREYKEKSLQQIIECVAELLTYLKNILNYSMLNESQKKLNTKSVSEQADNSNIILSKLWLLLDDSDKEQSELKEYIARSGDIILGFPDIEQDKLTDQIILIRDQTQKVITNEREKLNKL